MANRFPLFTPLWTKQLCVFAMKDGSYQDFVLKLHESIKNIMFHVLKKAEK